MTKTPDYGGPKYSIHGPEKHEAKGIPTNFYVRIDEGPFKGVEYSYTTIQNKGVDEDDNYHLTFDYVVLYSPPHLTKVIKKDFDEVLFNILTVILYETAAAIKQDITVVEDVTVDELDTTVPNEFHPEEFHHNQKPESD